MGKGSRRRPTDSDAVENQKEVWASQTETNEDLAEEIMDRRVEAYAEMKKQLREINEYLETDVEGYVLNLFSKDAMLKNLSEGVVKNISHQVISVLNVNTENLKERIKNVFDEDNHEYDVEDESKYARYQNKTEANFKVEVIGEV